jgi:hypothetical protein
MSMTKFKVICERNGIRNVVMTVDWFDLGEFAQRVQDGEVRDARFIEMTKFPSWGDHMAYSARFGDSA